jgi:hypothetical protein
MVLLKGLKWPIKSAGP